MGLHGDLDSSYLGQRPEFHIHWRRRIDKRTELELAAGRVYTAHGDVVVILVRGIKKRSPLSGSISNIVTLLCPRFVLVKSGGNVEIVCCQINAARTGP
jgi:hypothetical protein